MSETINLSTFGDVSREEVARIVNHYTALAVLVVRTIRAGRRWRDTLRDLEGFAGPLPPKMVAFACHIARTFAG